MHVHANCNGTSETQWQDGQVEGCLVGYAWNELHALVDQLKERSHHIRMWLEAYYFRIAKEKTKDVVARLHDIHRWQYL